MKIEYIETTDELDVLMNDYKHIIINVSADWCQPCKKLAGPLKEFVEKLDVDESFLFIKCDYDIMAEFQSFIDEYHVEKLPYFIFIEAGAMIDSAHGGDYEKISGLIRDFVIKHQSISFDSNSDF